MILWLANGELSLFAVTIWLCDYAGDCTVKIPLVIKFGPSAKPDE